MVLEKGGKPALDSFLTLVEMNQLDKEIRRIISRELKRGNPRQYVLIDNPGIGVRYDLSFALKSPDEDYVENLQRVFYP